MAELAVQGYAVKDPEWKLRVGKFIFYLTVAVSIWFIYWFAGIPCPC
jgi:hypothetical protein